MNLIIDQGDDMGPTSPRSCVDLRTGASGWLRVYKVTMVMLNYVSLGTLQAYENLIERMPSNPAAGSNGALRRRSREGRGRQRLGCSRLAQAGRRISLQKGRQVGRSVSQRWVAH